MNIIFIGFPARLHCQAGSRAKGTNCGNSSVGSPACGGMPRSGSRVRVSFPALIIAFRYFIGRLFYLFHKSNEHYLHRVPCPTSLSGGKSRSATIAGIALLVELLSWYFRSCYSYWIPAHFLNYSHYYRAESEII